MRNGQRKTSCESRGDTGAALGEIHPAIGVNNDGRRYLGGARRHGYSMKNAALAEIQFPLCDAAIRKIDGGDWELADAIVAECSETGDDGVKNKSYAKMEAMRQEIAKNRGVELSFEQIRKLRKVASAFPPGRRRPAV